MLAIEWFESNHKKQKKDKCRLLLSGFKHEAMWETLARVKFGKARNENFLVSLLIGT